MDGYILYNNKVDAEALITRLESEYLPMGNITTKYSNVLESNNENYIGSKYAVRIINIIYNSLSNEEKNNIIESLPNDFYETEKII